MWLSVVCIFDFPNIDDCPQRWEQCAITYEDNDNGNWAGDVFQLHISSILDLHGYLPAGHGNNHWSEQQLIGKSH